MSTSQTPQPLTTHGGQPQKLADPSEDEDHALHANSTERQQFIEAATSSNDMPQAIHISAQGNTRIEAEASEGSDLGEPGSESVITDVSVEDGSVQPCHRHTAYRTRRCTACAKYYCYEAARKEFPKEGIEVAIAKYAALHEVKHIPFRDEDGKLCIWREDINYLKEKQFFAQKRERFMDSLGRLYCWLPSRFYLPDVDKPKEFAKMVAHYSEKGWNLPTTHKWHFLKLPQEIRDKILAMALTVEAPSSLQPSMIQTNRKQISKIPTYNVTSEHFEEPRSVTSRIQVKDKDRSYIELRKVFRRAIDATILRTCRDFNTVGTQILYGQNTFQFCMFNGGMGDAPLTAMTRYSKDGFKEHYVFKPNPRKPVQGENYPTIVGTAIFQVQHQVHFCKIPGWVYHDPFLRFLHVIGPKKSAMIQNMVFSGKVRLHLCSDHCGGCEDGLIRSLQLYLPFIMKICTGLERLTIYAIEDGFGPQAPEEPEFDEDGELVVRLSPYEIALKQFVENYLWRIPTLKQLKIFGYDKDRVVDFAVPTIDLVKERWIERKRDLCNKYENVMALVKSGEVNVQCGFCDEVGHVWAECHNLCSFCGDYGHERETCWSHLLEITVEEALNMDDA